MAKSVLSARVGFALLIGALVSVSPACSGQPSSNLLSNPGFELDHDQTLQGWQRYGPNVYNESTVIAHDGTNYLKVYQSFAGTVNYSGVYQDYISGPGAIYSADGWAYTVTGDALSGNNAAWIEITFR